MSIEIRRFTRNDHNYAIFKDGTHVNAIAEYPDGWRIFRRASSQLAMFDADELAQINDFKDSLNAGKGARP